MRAREETMKDSDCKFPELLTPKETAVLRRTTTGHLANDRSRGLGPPYVKLGGRIFYPAAQLREYITAHIVDPKRRAG
jgi:hypothetical protein